MKNYYRIILGKKSSYADECFKNNFIGADYDMNINFTGMVHEDWRKFNETYIPIYLSKHPDKTKIAAGLACGALYTIIKGIQKGDVVLCHNGKGAYLVGEITGDYEYQLNGILPHRRPVKWFDQLIQRTEMSESLRNSAGSIGTISDLSKYGVEIENFISGKQSITVISKDETIEDPSVFVLEKHLEDFLVQNWKQTELGQNYDIYEEDGELVGQQYPTETGPIDILAISKDKKTILVVELKKGRASDNVIGQIQRYMGYVLEELAEENQTVKGVIVALENDARIRLALKVTNNIEFYKYQVSFKLFKGE